MDEKGKAVKCSGIEERERYVKDSIKEDAKKKGE
jgi:hypothetical protein